MVDSQTAPNGEKRYRLLETTKEYAHRRLIDLGIHDDVERRYARYFLEVVRMAESDMGRPAFAAWVDRIGGSYLDVRRGIAWSLAHESRAETLRIAPALFHVWYRTGAGREAGTWGARMLEGAGQVDARLRAWTHLAVAMSANLSARPQVALEHSEAAVELLRPTGGSELVMALFGRGAAALDVGDLVGLQRFATEALEICDRVSDRWARAGPLAQLSFALLFSGGSLDDARRLAEESQTLYRELGDAGSMIVMNPLSEIALRQGDVEGAERYAFDMATLAVGSGWEASALVNLGRAQLAGGKLEIAETTLRRALVRALETGLENWFRLALGSMALMLSMRGDHERAATLLGASWRSLPEYGADPSFRGDAEATCRSSLGDAAFERLEDAGYHMDHVSLLEIAGSSR